MAVSCVQLLGLIALATFALAISPIDHSHDRHRHEDPDDDVIIEATKEKFENVIEELDFVAVVFYTKNCKECDEALRELEYIDDDLDKYGIEMIKINNIEVAAEHGVTTFPTLIFWRREDPILYEGKFDDREVFDWLIHHKNSYVKVLTDDNFERVTQAASGATTGDWFVLFYEGSDKLCQKVMPSWESVGARLDHKMSIGKVDTEINPELDERFGVKQVPKIGFFRQGKMFLYNRNEFDSSSLLAFAGKWYRTVKPERVPRPIGRDLRYFREEMYLDPLSSEISTRNFLLSMAAACIGLISAATLMIVVFTGLGYLKINSDNMVPHKIDKTQ